MVSEGDEEQSIDQILDSLDFSGIPFPSDVLTVGAIRRKNSHLFDHGFRPGSAAQPEYFFQSDQPGHAEEDLGNLLFAERLIATESYLIASGFAGVPEWEVDPIKVDLVQSYVEYGLANGSHEAAEMIREIERQGRLLSPKRGR